MWVFFILPWWSITILQTKNKEYKIYTKRQCSRTVFVSFVLYNEFKLLLDIFIDKSRIDSGETYNKHSRKPYKIISNSNIVHVFSFDFDRVFYSLVEKSFCTVLCSYSCTLGGDIRLWVLQQLLVNRQPQKKSRSADWPSLIASQYVAMIAGQAVQKKATRGQFLICCVQERLF